MDFPIFHLDLAGNRLLIGVIAAIHVFINHAFAVGAMPLIVLLEWWGYRSGQRGWDHLAKRVLLVCFIVTTTVGALTGVGIWLSAALVNPAAIGSLIRVFFWAWFAEWIIFVLEVMLILTYYLTWDRLADRKKLHIRIGVVLSIASWGTMAIIVAILGFMMDTGSWSDAGGLLRGVFNPIYLPQLLFRTPAAMIAAGCLVLLLIPFFAERTDGFRTRAARLVSIWVLLWTPVLVAGGWSYWQVIPEFMRANVPIALTTQAFQDWYDTVAKILAGAAIVSLLAALATLLIPRYVPRPVMIVPFVLVLALLGSFERVREFIRKPYVINNYMYANGLRTADYPLYREKGMLGYAAFTPVRSVTPENNLQAGEAVFMLACTRCHTVDGVNGARNKLLAMYGQKPWDSAAIAAYMRTMHNTRPFMPPFPGSDVELTALADYLVTLQ